MSDATSQDGDLTWPETHRDLLPGIRERWGLEGDIHLFRRLSGKSGAIVFAADLVVEGFSGQAILKLDRAADPEWEEESEAERHRRAFEVNPGYAAGYLPKLLKTLVEGDKIAILSTIAGRGLEYALPWNECTYEQQLRTARLMSAELLESWNDEYHLAPGLVTPKALLESWLDYRLQPLHGRIHDFLENLCGLEPLQPTFVFRGRWYPNPLAFALGEVPLPEHARIRPVKGNQHGDLHGFNVLVSSHRKPDGRPYHLIDLAMYSDDQYLFYDHANFELAYLLMSRDSADLSNWNAILGQIDQHSRSESPTALKGDDLGLIQLVGSVRHEMADWIERHESNRLSHMEAQMTLARVATGLSFVHKRLSPASRRLALLYAASNLRDYLELQDLDWPMDGPSIEHTAAWAGTGEGQRTPGSDSRPPARPRVDTLPEKPGIAVLPFESLGEDTEQEHFADGVTQEIIVNLSHIEGYAVISRGSTFSYKGETPDPRKAAHELGVRYVVTGSVRRAETRVRITAELIDSDNGSQIWAERYDREVKDLFSVQDEIARAMVGSLFAKMRSTDRARASRIPRDRLDVWDLHQRAMWHFYQFTADDDAEALTLAQETIDRVPSFAPPYALQAYILGRQVFTGVGEPTQGALEEALAIAQKAVSLDESDSFCRAALGRLYQFIGNGEAAIRTLQTAIELNPSSSLAHFDLAIALAFAGRAEEGLEMIDQSIRLSPRDPLRAIQSAVKGMLLYFVSRFDEAEAIARESISFNPGLAWAHLVLALALVRQEKVEEAHAAAKMLTTLRPRIPEASRARMLQSLASNYRKATVEGLRSLGFPLAL